MHVSFTFACSTCVFIDIDTFKPFRPTFVFWIFIPVTGGMDHTIMVNPSWEFLGDYLDGRRYKWTYEHI